MKFEDFYAYCSHLIKEHQKSTKANVKCPICKNYFNRGPLYQNHIRTHLKICQIEVNRLNINKCKTYKLDKTNDKLLVEKPAIQKSKVKTKNKRNRAKKIKKKDIIVIDE